jgi:hypothetical protein
MASSTLTQGHYNIGTCRNSFPTYGNPGSYLEMYIRDHAREYLIINKSEMKRYFSMKNKNFVQGILQRKIKESTGIDIPFQDSNDVERLQILQMDVMPRGYVSMWNEMFIKDAHRIFTRNLRMAEYRIEKNLRGHNNLKFPHPQVTKQRGEKSTDIDYDGLFIKRGLSKPIRRSRRHNMLSFITEESKNFTYANLGGGRKPKDDNRVI